MSHEKDSKICTLGSSSPAMMTLVATRYTPVIQAQYQQLLRRGKEASVPSTRSSKR